MAKVKENQENPTNEARVGGRGKSNVTMAQATSVSRVPFPMHLLEPPKKIAHLAVLREVKYEALPEKDNPEIVNDIIRFVFTSPDGTYEFNQLEFPVKDDITGKRTNGEEWIITVDEQIKQQNDRIAHIFDAFMGVNAAATYNGEGLGMPYVNDVQFAKDVADAFNTGKDGKPVFKDDKDKYIFCQLKLVFDNKNNLTIPRYGNFFEVLPTGNKPSILSYNQKWDNLTPVETKADKLRKRNSGGGTSEPEVPENFYGGGDLPDGFV